MKINIRFLRLFLFVILLVIYGMELLFWYVMMKRNIFLLEYISWWVIILLIFVWIFGFVFYLCENVEKWFVFFMKLFSFVVGYILVVCVVILDVFVMWDMKLFIDNYVDFFCFGFFGSYIILLIFVFLFGIFDNFLDM